jgi:hypothetical protein
MAGLRRPSNANVVAMLNRYRCPTPFHAVRARFMGPLWALDHVCMVVDIHLSNSEEQ